MTSYHCCHVCLLTIKHVSTVQYLSISFPYIHNLRFSHFSQLKGNLVAVELRGHATALIEFRPNLEILTCDLLIYIMNPPRFIVPNQMEEFIGL